MIIPLTYPDERWREGESLSRVGLDQVAMTQDVENLEGKWQQGFVSFIIMSKALGLFFVVFHICQSGRNVPQKSDLLELVTRHKKLGPPHQIICTKYIGGPAVKIWFRDEETWLPNKDIQMIFGLKVFSCLPKTNPMTQPPRTRTKAAWLI